MKTTKLVVSRQAEYEETRGVAVIDQEIGMEKMKESGVRDLGQAMDVADQVSTLALEARRVLPMLQLTAYAADAMRVLSTLEDHAQQSPAADQMLRRICQDWRNPGVMHDPRDLISDALARLATDLENVVKGMEAMLSSEA